MPKTGEKIATPNFLVSGAILVIIVGSVLMLMTATPYLEKRRINLVKVRICQQDAIETKRQGAEAIHDPHTLKALDSRSREFVLGWDCMEPGIPKLIYVWGPGHSYFLNYEKVQKDAVLQALFEKAILANSQELLKSTRR